MGEIKVLGIVGSPRKNGNTAKLVARALEGAGSVPGIKTDFYEMAGRKYHHCIACFRCKKTGMCVLVDDFQGFAGRYLEADGIILGAPVYHMAIPASMKAALDRLSNSIMNNSLMRGRKMPVFNKVCGVLTVGAHPHGGQEFVLSFLVNSSLLMNGIVVSGDSMSGDYIGTAAYSGLPSAEGIIDKEPAKSKESVLNDKRALGCAKELGKRVAQITKIVRAGMSALEKELPDEYFYKSEEFLGAKINKGGSD